VQAVFDCGTNLSNWMENHPRDLTKVGAGFANGPDCSDLPVPIGLLGGSSLSSLSDEYRKFSLIPHLNLKSLAGFNPQKITTPRCW
jgi:hypothetical protein